MYVIHEFKNVLHTFKVFLINILHTGAKANEISHDTIAVAMY